LKEKMMDIKPIRTEADYRATLREIESLMRAESESPEGERLDVLVTLIEAYERQHFPLDLPDPVEALKFVMDQRGYHGGVPRLPLVPLPDAYKQRILDTLNAIEPALVRA